MAYSYNEPVDGAFPDPVSQVRYWVGDTEPVAPFSLSDGEISYELSDPKLTAKGAAANVAYKMSTRYGKALANTSKSVGNFSLQTNYKNSQQFFAALAMELRSGTDATAGAAIGPIYDHQDVQPSFWLGQFDYNQSGYGTE